MFTLFSSKTSRTSWLLRIVLCIILLEKATMLRGGATVGLNRAMARPRKKKFRVGKDYYTLAYKKYFLSLSLQDTTRTHRREEVELP
jgi:hypothetical protein